MLRGLCGLPAALLVAAPAFAETTLGPVVVSGYVEYEYLDFDGGEEDSLSADLGFSLQPQGGAGGFGVDGALLAIAIDDESYSALFLAGTYTAGWGKLSFGVPRPAYSDLDLPDVGGIRLFGLELPLDKSVAELAYFLGEEDAPLGLRYDGTFDRLAVAASLHRFADDDVTVTDLTASYSLADGRIFGGIEHTRIPDESRTDYILGIEGAFGGSLSGFGAGAAVFDRETIFDQSGGQIWATYAPIERLEITGTGIFLDDTSLYGLSAEYTFGPGAYVQGGIADSDDSDSVMDLSVGFRF